MSDEHNSWWDFWCSLGISTTYDQQIAFQLHLEQEGLVWDDPETHLRLSWFLLDVARERRARYIWMREEYGYLDPRVDRLSKEAVRLAAKAFDLAYGFEMKRGRPPKTPN